MTWRKASRSNGTGGSCVETAATGRTVAIRDSKNPGGAKLAVNRGAWTRFVRSLR